MKEKMPYIIKLQLGNATTRTYRVDERLFYAIKNRLAPYRSMPVAAKKIKCIETGMIFKGAKDAMHWLFDMGRTKNDKAFMRIKLACNKKQGEAYGFHWIFLDYDI